MLDEPTGITVSVRFAKELLSQAEMGDVTAHCTTPLVCFLPFIALHVVRFDVRRRELSSESSASSAKRASSVSCSLSSASCRSWSSVRYW